MHKKKTLPLVNDEWERVVAEDDGLVRNMPNRPLMRHCLVPYRGGTLKSRDPCKMLAVHQFVLEDTSSRDLIEPYSLFDFNLFRDHSGTTVKFKGRMYNIYYSCPMSGYTISKGESIFVQQPKRLQFPSLSNMELISHNFPGLEMIAPFLNSLEICCFAFTCKHALQSLLAWQFGIKVLQLAPVVNKYNILTEKCPLIGPPLQLNDISADAVVSGVLQSNVTLLSKVKFTDFEMNPTYPWDDIQHGMDQIEKHKESRNKMDKLIAKVLAEPDEPDDEPISQQSVVPCDWLECLKVHDGVMENLNIEGTRIYGFKGEACYKTWVDSPIEQKHFGTQKLFCLGSGIAPLHQVLDPNDPCYGYIVCITYSNSDLPKLVSISFSQLISNLHGGKLNEGKMSQENYVAKVVWKSLMKKWPGKVHW